MIEGVEGVVEDFFVDLGVEVVDKKFGVNVDCFLFVGGCFIDVEGFVVNMDVI